MMRISWARSPVRADRRLSVVGALIGVFGALVGYALSMVAARALHLPLMPGWLLFAAMFLGGLIGARWRGLSFVCLLLVVALAGCGSGGWRHDGNGGTYWGSGQGDLFITVRTDYPDKPSGASFVTTVVVDGLTEIKSSDKFIAGSGTRWLECSYRLKADPVRNYSIRATLTRFDTGEVINEAIRQRVVEEDHTTTMDIEL